MKEYLEVVPNDLLDMLEKGEESEVLTIITMSLYYYQTKYNNRSLDATLSLVKKGFNKLVEYMEED